MKMANLIWSYLSQEPLLWLTATLLAYWAGDAIYRATVPLASVVVRRAYGIAGSAMSNAERFQYRFAWPSGDWGSLPIEDRTDLAHVLETRSGVGGVSGVESAENVRKFVVDFTGGPLDPLPADSEVEPIVTVHGGEVVSQSFQRVWGSDIWRLALDIKADSGATVEMVAHVAGFGRKLSETWLYQWINA